MIEISVSRIEGDVHNGHATVQILKAGVLITFFYVDMVEWSQWIRFEDSPEVSEIHDGVAWNLQAVLDLVNAWEPDCVPDWTEPDDSYYDELPPIGTVGADDIPF